MIGAIIGDLVGSVYEFNNYRSKDFPLLSKDSFITDDSILTLAVAEIIQNKWYNDKDKVVDTMKKWGRAYPDRGYGGRFALWLFSDQREAYNSFGNGAPMRISPVGWYARSEEEVRDLSRILTEVTHSHPEGIKGAEVVSMCVYYAKIGKSKEFIKEYVEKYYDIDFTYDDLVKNYKFNELSQTTVPQAIYCFLISNSFEDCLRTTISIGGDSDTLAAISCAIADAFYKNIDENLIIKMLEYLPKPLNGCDPLKVIREFLDYRYTVSVTTESISEKPYMVASIYKNCEESYIEWIHSKTIKPLSEYIIFDVIGEYFVGDDDLARDLLNDRNIDGFVDVICDNHYENSQVSNALINIKSDLNKLLRINTFEELELIISKINDAFLKEEIDLEFQCFASSSEALDYLENNNRINDEMYDIIFIDK